MTVRPILYVSDPALAVSGMTYTSSGPQPEKPFVHLPTDVTWDRVLCWTVESRRRLLTVFKVFDLSKARYMKLADKYIQSYQGDAADQIRKGPYTSA